MDLYYLVRCDKHAFKPYEYCEMCMIRSDLQNAVDINRKTVEKACTSMNLSIQVIYDMLANHKKILDELIMLKG